MTATDTISVKATKAGWRIAVHSDDDSGKLRSGSTYLTNRLNISASSITGETGDSITPPLTTSTNQVLLTGIARTQVPQTSTITYSQIPNWADNAVLSFESGCSQDITITGALPTEIKGGGRYAAIYAESNSMEKGNMKIKLAALISVIITVLGEEVNYSGEISNFLIDHPASTKQQNISFLFTNTGNCHYKVKIESLLKDKAGTILANTSEPLSFDPVLPLFSKLLKTSRVLKKKLNPGAYYVDVKVRLEDDTILASKEVEFKATARKSDSMEGENKLSLRSC